MNFFLPGKQTRTLIWLLQEIGTTVSKVRLADAATLNIRTNGTQLIGTSDDCCFLHRTLHGDGALTCQVSSLQNTHVYAKAGLQIRRTLSADSPNAMIEWTPSRWAYFQYRAVTGGSVTWWQYVWTTQFPLLLRISRTGNEIKGYLSEDGGKTFKQVGKVNLELPEKVFIGMVVTSNSSQATTALMGNFLLEGNSS